MKTGRRFGGMKVRGNIEFGLVWAAIAVSCLLWLLNILFIWLIVYRYITCCAAG